MTQAQKIIKYFSVAFAVFLIVSIISALLSGGYALINAFGLIPGSNETSSDLKVISSGVSQVSSLDIDLIFTDLEIKTGETFKAETNNPKITFTNNNGSVKIKENEKSLLSNIDKKHLIVYIPENMPFIKETKVEGGAGKINIEELNTGILDFELGAGNAYIEKLTSKTEVKIEGGAGKIELRNALINNLEANLAAGEFCFNGKLIGKSKITSGVGRVKIDLTDSQDNYTIKAEKGLGNITLGGQELETNGVYGMGSSFLSVDSGVGEIEIDFAD